MDQRLLANYRPGGGVMREAKEDRSTRVETRGTGRLSEPERWECNLSANITRAETESKRWRADRKIEQKKKKSLCKVAAMRVE